MGLGRGSCGNRQTVAEPTRIMEHMGRPRRVVSVRVAAPTARVWAVLADAQCRAGLFGHIMDVTDLAAPQNGPASQGVPGRHAGTLRDGSTWTERRMHAPHLDATPRFYRVDVRVTHCEPGVALVLSCCDRDACFDVRFVLTAAAAPVDVRAQAAVAEVPGAFWGHSSGGSHDPEGCAGLGGAGNAGPGDDMCLGVASANAPSGEHTVLTVAVIGVSPRPGVRAVWRWWRARCRVADWCRADASDVAVVAEYGTGVAARFTRSAFQAAFPTAEMVAATQRAREAHQVAQEAGAWVNDFEPHSPSEFGGHADSDASDGVSHDPKSVGCDSDAERPGHDPADPAPTGPALVGPDSSGDGTEMVDVSSIPAQRAGSGSQRPAGQKSGAKKRRGKKRKRKASRR